MIFHCPSCDKIIDTEYVAGYILVIRVEKKQRIRIYSFCHSACLKVGMNGERKAARPIPKPIVKDKKPRPNKENIKLVLRKKK